MACHSLERALTVASAPAEPLLVVVLGPTASGKTALSLALAERFHGEIVNCDSVAMYRAVSYTHLDVYKRQAYFSSCSK